MLIPLDAPSALIPVALIDIRRDERQRREITTDDLEPSIREKGLLNPIVIRDLGTGRYELIAGERRLTAFQRLGLASIPCRFAEGLTPVELKLIELEENIKRKDLPWPDMLAAVEEIHSLHLSLDADWSQEQTAEIIGLSQESVSRYLVIAQEAKAEPELLERKTLSEAKGVLTRRKQRQMGQELENLFHDMKTALGKEDGEALQSAADKAQEAAAVAAAARSEEILNESFLDWAPTYAGEKFNLIHCDFPYGVELFAKEFGQRGGAKPYADSKDVYFALLDCLLTHLDRLMTLNAHLVFWFSGKYDRETRDAFAQRAPSLDFMTHPFVWGKSDNRGIIGDARRDLRHTYEHALVARRGGRHLVKSVSDFYSAPSDQSLHPSTKPEPMLAHLFSALVDEHTSLLDPTCGSGSALRAADSIGASRVLGLEIDREFCNTARVALRNARKLRTASATASL